MTTAFFDYNCNTGELTISELLYMLNALTAHCRRLTPIQVHKLSRRVTSTYMKNRMTGIEPVPESIDFPKTEEEI